MIRQLVVVSLLFLASAAFGQTGITLRSQIAAGTTYPQITVPRKGVVRCVYFQPWTVNDLGTEFRTINGQQVATGRFSFSASGAAVVDEEASAKMPIWFHDEPDGLTVNHITLNPLGAMSSVANAAYSGGTAVLSIYAYPNGVGNPPIIRFLTTDSTVSWLRSIEYSSTSSFGGAGRNHFGQTVNAEFRHTATPWAFCFAAHAGDRKVDIFCSTATYNTAGGGAQGTPGSFKLATLEYFPGEDWLMGLAGCDLSEVVDAIDSMKDLLSLQLFQIKNLLDSYEGAGFESDFDSNVTKPTVDERDNQDLDDTYEQMEELQPFPYVPPVQSNEHTAWEFTLPMATWTSIGGGGPLMADLDVSIDLSFFSVIRTPFRACLILLISIWGACRVWSELRRY
jgi:hypothetical protein